jgi:hypothetical protein
MWNRLRRRSRQSSLGSERGQALVLIALAFIGLAAFVGLTVDAGILFSYIGHLRRATDAASLAAANQFREGRDPVELSEMAFEMLQLNGLDPLGVVAKVCDLEGGEFSIYNDSTLCPPFGPLGTNPPTGPEAPRKFVRVETEMQVNFAFLPIIGWDSTVIRANSISEAASIDVVLAIDVSDSMTVDLCYDTRDNDLDGTMNDCYETTGPASEGPNGIYEDDAQTCVDVTLADGPDEDKCHPFEEVREAAKQFVGRMYFPYDRVSIVTFGRLPTIHLELDTCNDPDAALALACVVTKLDDIQVEAKPAVGANPAVNCDSGGTPRGCMTTNIGDGLRQAGGRFCIDDNPANGLCDRAEMREEAVWIVILLTDGAANAGTFANPPVVFDDWVCPASTYPPLNSDPPWCRDTDSSPGTRHPDGDAEYDADDYARDMADFVGCPNPNLAQPVDGSCASTAPGGQGAVIFAIGLGKYVWDNPDDPTNPRAGERLLRYAASAGDDGDPGFDPFCEPDPGTKVDCGNYYFSPTGAGLIRVFEAIASRIFTRITH